MNVLFFSSFNLPPHFVGLNLEFIQRNLDEGNTVYLIDCHSSFKECGFNPYKLKYMCEICKFRENKGLDLLKGKIHRIPIQALTNEDEKNEIKAFLQGFSTLDKDCYYENFPFGESIHSSYISKTRERNFSSLEDQELLRRLALNTILTYKVVDRFIKQKNIEELYLFNGRWDYYRAALSAANENSIKVEIFEYYRSGGYIEKFGNNLPHNIKNKNRLIEEAWEQNENLEEKLAIADNFFKKKRDGIAVNDKAYTADQEKGKIPSEYNKDKKTFVLFNSSDDEFAAVGKEFDNPYFNDQLEGILYLVEYFKNKPDYQLFLRMHPNLKGLVRDFLEPIYALENKYSNIFLIRPEEDIDSYELMNIADTVISFGSTAGLEASYWGTPVILLGKTFYYYSDIAYVPKSRDEIPSLLDKNLSPHEKLNSQKFGYYIERGGEKAKYYLNDANRNISFKGTGLNKLPGWFKIYYKTLKLLNVKN
ncbi:capsular polysaccharide export protein, LipB/KpsS family [Salegentibacter agarivorans]